MNFTPGEIMAEALPSEQGRTDGGLFVIPVPEEKRLVVSAFGAPDALRLTKTEALWLAQMLIDRSREL